MAASSDEIFLQKFWLYETRAKYYIVGTDKSGLVWRVLKIDRLEPSELAFEQDPTVYSESEVKEFVDLLNAGNRPTGGLHLVKEFYGIAGFIKFLGPHYMLLITQRRKIGEICGHAVYAVSKSEIITVQSPLVQKEIAYSKDENRYKRLLGLVDLSKDFFFSYTYNIMQNLQNNVTQKQTGEVFYETMAVWNEFLTHEIRNQLRTTVWTIALVHGFYKEEKLSISGRDFKVVLIARRSRHFAGTRYRKRGVNERGRVANDVETEQIVFEDAKDVPPQISSVVQNRGSIPLFWSQETSAFNFRPNIMLHQNQDGYRAARLHFQNLECRYGSPIIILNLIKKREKVPRESVLHTEYRRAIERINRDLPEDKHLREVHWDFNKHSRRRGVNVLNLLVNVARDALEITEFFHCLLATDSKSPSDSMKHILRFTEDNGHAKENGVNIDNSISESCSSSNVNNREILTCMLAPDGRFHRILADPVALQNGVVRTNCIDSLDRTNVAQFAYGLIAFGTQLKALGLVDVAEIGLDSLLADSLMNLYEKMGDAISLQYGGSAAHNKIFAAQRGEWQASAKYQHLLRILQRAYSNVYLDAEKQDAINLFLGHFQPQPGKPALRELDTDQHYSIGRQGLPTENIVKRSNIRRTLSEGNIILESNSLHASFAEQSETPILAATEVLEDVETPKYPNYASRTDPSVSSSNSQQLHRFSPGSGMLDAASRLARWNSFDEESDGYSLACSPDSLGKLYSQASL